MKVLSLKIGGKTHLSGKINAFLSKEAMKINKESIALGKKGKSLQNATEDEVLELSEELFEGMEQLATRKAWLICEVYGNKFTVDELEKDLSSGEIDLEINKIVQGVTGIITKN